MYLTGSIWLHVCLVKIGWYRNHSAGVPVIFPGIHDEAVCAAVLTKIHPPSIKEVKVLETTTDKDKCQVQICEVW